MDKFSSTVHGVHSNCYEFTYLVTIAGAPPKTIMNSAQ